MVITRRRRALGAAVAALFGVQAVTLAIVLRQTAAPSPPPPPIVTHVPITVPMPPPIVTHVPITVPMPMPIVIEPVIAAAPTSSPRPSCPPPNDDAPRASSLRDLPDDVDRVVTAQTNASWIAVWNDDAVRISLDGGRTFARALDGDGKVRDVTFDCFGRAIALRDDQIGVRDGTRETWRRVPGMRADRDAPAALVGGGPDVLVVGITDRDTWSARIAVSPDLGASWWFRDLVDYWETNDLTGRQDADGTIHLTLTTPDCMSDPVSWIRIENGVVATDELGPVGDVRLYGDIAINAGWEGVRWKRFGEESWHAVKGLPRDSRPDLVAGPIPRLVADGVVYAVERGRAAKVGTFDHAAYHTEYDADAVDRAGRLWSTGGDDDPRLVVR
jgi:hypothetical protein